ncbi:TolC family protein [Mucilaginibacter terrae]|uniref:Outer membrane protein TolC n=1 Tax=Mucilaginibacter terrae TaxID=1955052 RepID=A0ABU3GYW8_9SPHI|nr:TolC family protein [Mucilaginibacter terrae]MDT3404953.1 outer membrane protein TolC [Mucilaginibacter terrae]
MKNYYRVYLLLLLLSVPSVILAQTATDTTITNLTLQQCIDFALRNQPGVRQANIDEEINEKDIRISLSAWLPQVASTGAYQHYFQRFNAFGAQTGTGTGTGSGTSGAVPAQQLAIATNVSNLGVSATQALYNNEVMQASKASRYSRQYYKQNTVSAKIDVVTNVSKAFYDLLLSQRQLDIINQDIARLQRNLKDANSRYQAGVVDKIDAKQATIGLNNSLASRKQLQEAVNSRTAYLKQLMGYTPQRPLTAQYDSLQLVRELAIDTNQVLNVNNRIEYTMLETQKNLNNVNVSYYKYGFLPSVSAVGSYNLQYFNSSVSNLYKDAFPTSLVGLNISIPIFQGTKRLQNLSKARLQVKRTDLDLENTRNAINTEYTQAIANYKSNFTNYKALGENVELAKDVYNVVSLQYREGIKTYLDLIVAQTDLRTASLNYYNALFQLLQSKVDLQRALGTLPVQ